MDARGSYDMAIFKLPMRAGKITGLLPIDVLADVGEEHNKVVVLIAADEITKGACSYFQLGQEPEDGFVWIRRRSCQGVETAVDGHAVQWIVECTCDMYDRGSEYRQQYKAAALEDAIELAIEGMDELRQQAEMALSKLERLYARLKGQSNEKAAIDPDGIEGRAGSDQAHNENDRARSEG